MFAFCAREVPNWNTISISGYHIREAGSTAAQEVAFTFANAIAYVEAALDAGLEIDEFAPRLSFFFNCAQQLAGGDRQVPRGAAAVGEDHAGPVRRDQPARPMLRFHAQTAGFTLTAQQPDINMVRVAMQAMAAVLGGTQSLHTNGRTKRCRCRLKRRRGWPCERSR